MARTLQYLAIVEPIPPQTAAASNAPVGIEWHRPLSEPTRGRKPVSGDIVFPAFTGTQSVTPPVLWFQPLSEPTRGRKPVAGDIVFPAFTGNQSVTPSVLWFQPLSEPTRGRRPPTLNPLTLPPGVFSGTSNGPSGIEWYQPLSLPQYRRRPAYSQSILTFDPAVITPPEAGSCVSFCNAGLKVAYFTSCDLKVAYFDDSEFCPGGQC